ncbi:MAG: AAA domain-containing protein, partial [Actinomycetota bacterium]|nr:AAA domain-containing protein [Actinomycetota bacterium]
LDSTQEEGLFIKNLENVQGDERDAILFSTAFSVNERGVLPLNFGPLNRAGGERRLNVAVTRARRQVVLYSSFDPAQLRAEETTSVGIQHLRAYLDLAANGTRSMEEAVRRSGPVDRHREAVAQALRDRGLVVATDVGLSDFRIDLSISLAREPERRVLAVILDGPGWARRCDRGHGAGRVAAGVPGRLRRAPDDSQGVGKDGAFSGLRRAPRPHQQGPARRVARRFERHSRRLRESGLTGLR